MKQYTRISRYNPRITFEQYRILLERRKQAAQSNQRMRYRDLVNEWGIGQSVLGTALLRGIKQYDYRLWKRGEL